MKPPAFESDTCTAQGAVAIPLAGGFNHPLEIMHLNIEIKARCRHPENIKQILTQHKARYVGLDHQIDTYFILPEGKGRLKLREGNIENSLIHYRRVDQAGPKRSEVTLYRPQSGPTLKTILTDTLGVFSVVDKQRHIYFIKNVKFHLDTVKGLGDFVEIEAIDKDGTIGEEQLRWQCDFFLRLFELKKEDLIEVSYSDMLFRENENAKLA